MRARLGIMAFAALFFGCHDRPPPTRPAPPAPVGSASAPPSASPRRADAAEVADVREQPSPIGVSRTDPSWGSRRALVTIVRATPLDDKDPILHPRFREWLATKFGEANVRLVWLPFYASSMPPFAELGCAVHDVGGPRAFWSFVDALGSRGGGTVQSGELERWAQKASVNADRIREIARLPRCQAELNERLHHAERLFERHGVTTFVNGVRSFVIQYSSAKALEDDLEPLIAAELNAAQALVAKGTSVDLISAERTTLNVQRAAYASNEAARPVLDTSTVWRAAIGTGPTAGPADALVTAVLHCAPMHPACRWVFDRVRPLLARHSLRFVLRPVADKLNPCDAEAVALAAQATAEKGPKAYYDALDVLSAKQPKIRFATDKSGDVTVWNKAALAGNAPLCTEAVLRGAAKELGIRYDAYAKRLASNQIEKELQANRAEARTVDGETALFVNGRRLGFSSRGEPAPELSEAAVSSLIEQVISEEEKRAVAKVDQGTDPKRLYDIVTKDGYVRSR